MTFCSRDPRLEKDKYACAGRVTVANQTRATARAPTLDGHLIMYMSVVVGMEDLNF